MPAGFRIDWRGADAFCYDPSPVRLALDRIERAAGTVHEVARLVAMVICWWTSDSAQRLMARVEQSYHAGKRALRLPRWGRSGDTWIVTVNLMGQPGLGLETLAARLKDAAVERQVAAGANYRAMRV